MKKILLLLLGCVWLSACHSARVSSVPGKANETATIPELPDGSASLDSLPLSVNAAQIPFMDTQPVSSVIQKPGLASKKPTVLKTLQLARKLVKAHPETDSTELYVRRKQPDTRPVNRTAKASLLLGIGTYALLLLSALNIPFVGLLAFLAAIGAIVTGIVALSEIRRSGGQYRGKGQAIAGLVLGSSLVFLIAIAIVILLLFLASWR
jgi:hypothetical protein